MGGVCVCLTFPPNSEFVGKGCKRLRETDGWEKISLYVYIHKMGNTKRHIIYAFKSCCEISSLNECKCLFLQY